MSDKFRTSNRSDGSSPVTETGETREQSVPPRVSAEVLLRSSKPTTTTTTAAAGEPSRGHPRSRGRGGGDRDSSSSSSVPLSPCRGGLSTVTSPNNSNNSLLGFQSRSPLFRRLSSGYFSFEAESLPNSPLLHPPPVQLEDKSTQTPALSSQLVTHALHRMSVEAHSGEQWRGSPSSLHSSEAAMAGDTRTEIEIGLELRRMGDQFNNIILHRARGDQAPPHQEPTFLICMGILLLLITRLLYSQGITDNNLDQSQV